MATAGIEITAEIAELRELQVAIGRLFTPADKSKILKAALEKAIEPVFQRLKQITPVGPTGNLSRAVAKKVKSYSKDGGAVALVGFRRAAAADSTSAAGGSVRKGRDRARHQYWLEEGTDERRVNKLADEPYTRKAHKRVMKSGVVAYVQEHEVARQGGYIASSFNRLGGFEGFEPTPRPPRGQKGHRVQTRPGYPNAFFRKSSTPITIPPMPAGGRTGRPPLTTAFNETQATVAQILQRELRLSLEQALSTLTRSTGAIG